MEIIVKHHTDGSFVNVAKVEVPDSMTVEAAMNYAFRWTNNIDGSWSQGEFLNFCDNPDFNENVTRLCPLPEYGGRKYGVRSTSVFDRMEINGCEWEVASFGFERVA